MANKKITQLDEAVIAAGDYIVFVDDPAGTPITKRDTVQGILDLVPAASGGGPDGHMVNGKLSVTVSANDLVVALKTLAGADPTAGDKVTVRINGVEYDITAALSITLADGTNWFNSGSAELGTIEQDYFVNAVYDSNSSAVALSISRVPWGGNVSDYSGTTTAESHLYGHSGFTSTDPVQIIGRFAATLSLTGTGHLWTVPTFNNDNLKNRYINETRWLSWTPTRTGFSANPGSTVYQFKFISDTCYITGRDGTDGTSNANTNYLTLPFGAIQTANGAYQFIAACNNNSVTLTTPSYGAVFTPDWSLLKIGLDMSANFTGWATSNNKRVRTITGFYRIK